MAGQEKNVFGKPVTPYKAHSDLQLDVINSPHIRNSGKVDYKGRIGRGGVVIWEAGEIIGAVKGRRTIPRKIDSARYKVTFGGVQAKEYVEGNMAREFGMEVVQERCKQILAAVKARGMQYASSQFGGLFKIGAEVERFLADPQTGKPYGLRFDDQQELQDNLYETDVGVSADLKEMARMVALDAQSAAAQYPDALLNTTSMFMTGGPADMRVNRGKYERYVAAVAVRMFNEFFDPADLEARLVWDTVSRDHGYSGFYDMKRRTGTLATLAFAAGHESLGLDNVLIHGQYRLPLELTVAASQMFNSNQATFAEMVCYSTPFVFGRPVTYKWKDKTNYAQDARAVMRLASQTAYESPTVHSAKEFKQLVSFAVEHQYADRLGRAAQISRVPQWHGIPKVVVSSHGRTRARIEQPSLFENYAVPMGRQEFVGSPATSDITAAVARKAYLQLLGLGAIEALAHGRYPIDYFKYRFPLLCGWKEQRELAHEYNFNGTGSKAAAVLDEVVEYVKYMAKHYPADDVRYAAEIVEATVQRMRQPAQSRDLDDFMFNMEGMLPDVLVNRYSDIGDVLQLSREVHRFQLRQAQQIIGANGDVLRIIPPVKKGVFRTIFG